MSELDDKLNSILSNLQMMRQIMSLAQSMGQTDSSASTEHAAKSDFPSTQGLSASMLGRLSSVISAEVSIKNSSLCSGLYPHISAVQKSKNWNGQCRRQK